MYNFYNHISNRILHECVFLKPSRVSLGLQTSFSQCGDSGHSLRSFIRSCTAPFVRFLRIAENWRTYPCRWDRIQPLVRLWLAPRLRLPRRLLPMELHRRHCRCWSQFWFPIFSWFLSLCGPERRLGFLLRLLLQLKVETEDNRNYKGLKGKR